MKHKKAKTAEDLIVHFQKRCMERVGHIIKQRTLKEGMQNGWLKQLGYGTNSRTNWKMNLQTGSYVVVYDKIRHAFVTIMYYDEWIAKRRPDLKFAIKHPKYCELKEENHV
ncbi:MAG: hypothetical protein J6W16_01560 [Methanobrevibacter sp.]|nr:hypothetical protein [Methanobrevibacter sp.]